MATTAAIKEAGRTRGVIPVWSRGDKLKKARIEANVSGQEMGDFLGVSRYTISNYENDQTEPSCLQVWLWSRLTGVDPTWLDERVTYEFCEQMEKVVLGPMNTQWSTRGGDFDPDGAAMAA